MISLSNPIFNAHIHSPQGVGFRDAAGVAMEPWGVPSVGHNARIVANFPPHHVPPRPPRPPPHAPTPLTTQLTHHTPHPPHHTSPPQWCNGRECIQRYVARLCYRYLQLSCCPCIWLATLVIHIMRMFNLRIHKNGHTHVQTRAHIRIFMHVQSTD